MIVRIWWIFHAILLFSLVYGGACVALWTSFQKDASGFIETNGIQNAFIKTNLQCLAWVQFMDIANVACYKRNEKLCVGFDIEIPSSEDHNVPEEWKCYTNGESPSNSGEVERKALEFSDTEATVDDGNSVCPSGYTMFAPDSLDHFKELRQKLVHMRDAGEDVPCEILIGIKKNSETNSWHNTRSGTAIFSHPTEVGKYPFTVGEPNSGRDCARLKGSDYLLADSPCTNTYKVACVPMAN